MFPAAPFDGGGGGKNRMHVHYLDCRRPNGSGIERFVARPAPASLTPVGHLGRLGGGEARRFFAWSMRPFVATLLASRF